MSTRLLLRRSLPQLKAAAFPLRRNLSPPPSIATPLSTPALSVRHASSSSNSNASLETNSPTQKQNQVHEDPDYVSIQEMKGLIEQYDKGDMDAIPSIFEAILKRKLMQKKSNLDSDPDLDQLLEGRRLGHESDSSVEDENVIDDNKDDEEETDLDSDWTGDDEKKYK